MNLGWLLKLYFLEDRIAIIILRIFKFGIIRTNKSQLNGFSIVFGIYRLESQINLSIIKNKIELRDYETGRA